MKIMRTLALAGFAVITMSACADLEVVNLNDPDRERAISTPGDVASLVLGSFQSWFGAVFERAPAHALNAAADEHSATWGNFGMNDIRRQPREPYNNDPSYSYSYVTETPWSRHYAALAGIRDGLIAIDGGIEIGTNGEHTQRTIAFARFVQGLSHGHLSLTFDQAFILDENTDLENAQLEPYTAVHAAAIQFLEQAISMANSNTFTIPGQFVGERDMSSTQMAQIAHSMIAYYMAMVPRTVAERDAVNWASVESHIDQGVQGDWLIEGTGTGPGGWGDWTKTWGGSYDTWSRMNVEWIGPADQSGEFQAWKALPVESRSAILIDTPDRRIIGDGGPESDGIYGTFSGRNSSPFPPARGTYAFSDYRDGRHDEYAGPFLGEHSIMAPASMDFLKAEALFRQGDQQGAVDIINAYRVPNGELQAVSLADPNPDCVPKMADGSCGDLWEVLKYEKRIEDYHYMGYTAFLDDRGWGDLITGTPIQLPVPGSELLVLLQDIYTWGGVGGEGGAPVDASEFNLALDAGQLTPEELSARARALENFRNNYGQKFDAIKR